MLIKQDDNKENIVKIVTKINVQNGGVKEIKAIGICLKLSFSCFSRWEKAQFFLVRIVIACL